MNEQELRQTLAQTKRLRDELQAITELATQREEAPLATACLDRFLYGFTLHAHFQGPATNETEPLAEVAAEPLSR